MDTVLMLWLVGGAVVLLAMMLLVVALARGLERDVAAGQAPVEQLMGLPAKMRGRIGLAAVAGPLANLLAHASAGAKSDGEHAIDPRTKKIRAAITGMAIAGGVLMLIVGLLTGRN